MQAVLFSITFTEAKKNINQKVIIKKRTMKKLLTTMVLVIITTLPLVAQNLVTQRKINFFTEYIDRFNTHEIYDVNNPDEFIGSPYYFNSFLLGNVYYNNQLLQKNIALRYNVFADEMEYKKNITDEDAKAQAIVKSQDIFVTIEDKAFVFIPSKGYFEVIYDGINFSYLKKITKKYYPAKLAKNTYDQGTPAEFQNRETLYIYTKEGAIFELPKSKKKRLKTFGNSEKIVNNYAKENNLNINDEKDLRKIIMYLDGVGGATL